MEATSARLAALTVRMPASSVIPESVSESGYVANLKSSEQTSDGVFIVAAAPQSVAANALSNTTVNVSWAMPPEFYSTLIKYT